jgi:hypothetical protein
VLRAEPWAEPTTAVLPLGTVREECGPQGGGEAAEGRVVAPCRQRRQRLQVVGPSQGRGMLRRTPASRAGACCVARPLSA